MKSVQYESFGGPEVLEIRDLPEPELGAGEVKIAVAAAGVNPIDYKIYHGGSIAEAFGVSLPTGIGNDLSGVVTAVGPGVTSFAVGDKVFAAARNAAVAEVVVVSESGVLPVPEGMDLRTAATLWIPGRTAWALVDSLQLKSSDTVLIGAAAGGVGSLAVQLARRTGATVIGTASEANHDYLRDLGAIPVTYGDGVIDRVRAAAQGPVTAVIDAQGPATITAGLELGVVPERIVTAASFGDDAQGARSVGGGDASTEELSQLADLFTQGEIRVSLNQSYALADVQEAYTQAETGHVRGKIVIDVNPDLL